MTTKQRITLMAELWPAAAAALGCHKEDRERRLEVFSAGLGRRIESGSEIGKMDDFTKLKGYLLALARPEDFNAQHQQTMMPCTNRIVAIRKLAPEPYIVSESRRKFFTIDWERLNLDQLTMLRNHLQARAKQIVWPQSAATVPAMEAEAVEAGVEVPF